MAYWRKRNANYFDLSRLPSLNVVSMNEVSILHWSNVGNVFGLVGVLFRYTFLCVLVLDGINVFIARIVISVFFFYSFFIFLFSVNNCNIGLYSEICSLLLPVDVGHWPNHVKYLVSFSLCSLFSLPFKSVTAKPKITLFEFFFFNLNWSFKAWRNSPSNVIHDSKIFLTII